MFMDCDIYEVMKFAIKNSTPRSDALITCILENMSARDAVTLVDSFKTLEECGLSRLLVLARRLEKKRRYCALSSILP